MLAGRVVAGAGRSARAQTAVDYRNLFSAAMAGKATRGRHANVLLHAFSQVGRNLGRPQQDDLLNRIESYRKGQTPPSVPVALLSHHASDGRLPWLAGQTYLQPFPDALRLRHSIELYR